MRRNLVSSCTLAALTLLPWHLAAAQHSPAATPKGDVSWQEFNGSKIFPGTKRVYGLYVPKQYDPAKPACVYVSEDGDPYNAPTVFDQLIQEKAMPVTVGVFVTPGDTAGRNNRSFEYDAMTGDYARFLCDELLPCVAKTHRLNLSTDGNDRAIAGISSGGICSFTAAWQRPDAFRRVFSNVGSFGAHRGGYVYAALVRKVEPKPIRVFLQDGSGDLRFAYGDWFLANQEMEAALSFAGYEVNHCWDQGGHNADTARAIFPQVMRWLWKDWPAPIHAGAGSPYLQQIVLPGEGWKPLKLRFEDATSPTANAKGEAFVCYGGPDDKIYKIGLRRDLREFKTTSHHVYVTGLSFGLDGLLYAAAGDKILSYDAGGKAAVVAEGIRGRRLTVGANGNIYVTSREGDRSKLWLVKPNSEKRVVDANLKQAAGVCFTADGRFLCVTDAASHYVYSYLIQPDGSLADKEPYCFLHVDTVDQSGADGMCADRDGRLYVATAMGVQVCEPTGQTFCIIPTPNGKVTGLCFGGPQFDTLIATCGDVVYQRKLRTRGVPPAPAAGAVKP
jgi:sugar lactone lactonase YvrE/enterochelin esterase-like enzyme